MPERRTCRRAQARARCSASEPLRRFLQVARGAGLRVSAAEGIDAARAVDLVGFADRAVLKDTLGLVLAKTPDEKALFDECFELYFKRDEFAGAPDAAEPPPAPEPMSAARPDGPAATAWAVRRRTIAGQMLLERRPRRAGGGDGTGGARGGPREHPLLHAEEPLCAAHSGPHGTARAGTRHGGDAPGRHDAAIVRAGRAGGHGSSSCATRCATSSNGSCCCLPRGETEKFREELLKIGAAVQSGAARPGPDARAGARRWRRSWPRATRRRGGGGCAGSWTCGARCGGTWAGAAFRSSPCGNRSASRSRG